MNKKVTFPVQRQRPTLMKISWVVIVYSFVLGAYINYWQWNHPKLTQAEVCQEFWQWAIPIAIMLLINIGYWYHDDMAYLHEYEKYEEYEKQKKQ